MTHPCNLKLLNIDNVACSDANARRACWRDTASPSQRGAFEGSCHSVTSTTQALELPQCSVLTALAGPGHFYTAGYQPESSC